MTTEENRFFNFNKDKLNASIAWAEIYLNNDTSYTFTEYFMNLTEMTQ